jgi:hypothetical protein
LAGEFAIVETGDVNDAENSRLYLWNGSVYSYVSDLSGSTGFTGPQGATGPQGPQGDIGPQGPQGPGVDANLSVTWANTQIFNANVTFNAGVIANSSIGANGEVLTSNGTSVYWGPAAVASNVFTSIVTYTYSISSNTTVITGADDDTLTLSYTAGLESVFLNGSKQISTTDYTTPNTAAIVFTSNVIAGDVVQIVAQIPALNVLEGVSNSQTTSTTANTIVDSFAKAVYRSAKYYIQITSGSDYHITEALLLHDGSEVYVTEYGTVFSNTSLGNVSANINSSNVNLLVAPINSSSVIKTKRITLDV